jgi:hypothetical protein
VKSGLNNAHSHTPFQSIKTTSNTRHRNRRDFVVSRVSQHCSQRRRQRLIRRFVIVTRFCNQIVDVTRALNNAGAITDTFVRLSHTFSKLRKATGKFFRNACIHSDQATTHTSDSMCASIPLPRLQSAEMQCARFLPDTANRSPLSSTNRFRAFRSDSFICLNGCSRLFGFGDNKTAGVAEVVAAVDAVDDTASATAATAADDGDSILARASEVSPGATIVDSFRFLFAVSDSVLALSLVVGSTGFNLSKWDINFFQFRSSLSAPNWS